MTRSNNYTVVGRCLEGVKVIAYVIKDNVTMNTSIVSKDATERLVMNKLVENCTGQFYDGKIIIKGVNCKLTDMPNYNLSGDIIVKEVMGKAKKVAKLEIRARVVYGKTTVGYIVRSLDSSSNTDRRLDRKTVVELARDGKIANARAQRFNDKMLLRGVNCELSQLPIIRINNQPI